jgi:hypothetical protein
MTWTLSPGLVEATDQLALDKGDAERTRRQRCRAVLPGRPAAEDDDVVVAHVGRSAP